LVLIIIVGIQVSQLSQDANHLGSPNFGCAQVQNLKKVKPLCRVGFYQRRAAAAGSV